MQIAPWVFPLTKETASVPRMCGEKIRAVSATTASVGSPPRVRGKAAKQAVLIKAYGITPACAGKRAGCTIARPPSWDHPRVCGEKYLYIRPQVARIGSPPRVRGKVFINSRQSPCHKDHPRVCGEKTVYDFAYAEKGGSPPRVRGKAPTAASACPPLRITPACAGKRSG